MLGGGVGTLCVKKVKTYKPEALPEERVLPLPASKALSGSGSGADAASLRRKNVKILYFCMSREMHTFWQLHGAVKLGFSAVRARQKVFLHSCSSTAARTDAHLCPLLLDVRLWRWLHW